MEVKTPILNHIITIIKLPLQKYLGKVRSRYNAKVIINGDKPLNYKLNAKLKGFLDF